MTIILEPARPAIEIGEREAFTLDLKGMRAGLVAKPMTLQPRIFCKECLGIDTVAACVVDCR
jgi:hypothetical protein